jgi:hypothetical protein
MSQETLIGIILGVLLLVLIAVLILGYIFSSKYKKGNKKLNISQNYFLEATSIELSTEIGANR